MECILQVLFKYLKGSLVSLEVTCQMLHINRHVLKQMCIGNLQELVLDVQHIRLDYECCEITTLRKFSQLRKLVFVNVSNSYILHLSKSLSQVRELS